MVSVYVVGIAFSLWLLFRMLEWFIRLAYRMATVRVLLIDPDSGNARIVRVRTRGNEFYLKDKAFILDQKTRLSTKDGPLWIVHSRHGWNFRGPEDEEIRGAHPGYNVLMQSNPSAYYLAIKHNDARDSLEANHGGPDWIVQIAPWAFFLLLVVVGMLGYVLFILSKGTS